jgi:hypothetical protein
LGLFKSVEIRIEFHEPDEVVESEWDEHVSEFSSEWTESDLEEYDAIVKLEEARREQSKFHKLEANLLEIQRKRKTKANVQRKKKVRTDTDE